MTDERRPALVGPVLEAGELAVAVIAAIRQAHPDVQVRDRGSYLRVSVPTRCALARAEVERALGRAFDLPGHLEQIMPAFAGRLTLTRDHAVWEAEQP